ncbi:MAG: hypothetical protein JW786_15145 [Desulfobacterales bacterium]|nr:hypothetical protein [Desulfobacterales bacterium]
MIDYHSHLLPDVDDGSKSIEESLEMARILVAAGFKEVYCTPHCIKGVYENTRENIQPKFAQLQNAINEAGISLVVHPGMEYYLDEFFVDHLHNPQTLGNSDLILVEAPPLCNPEIIKENIFQINRHKLKPLLAHPERCELLTADKSNSNFWSKLKNGFSHKSLPAMPDTCLNSSSPFDLCEDLINMGCLFQGNIGSFAGIYGKQVQKKAQNFLKEGYYSYFGSDGHSSHTLENFLSQGMKKCFIMS